MNKNTKFIVTYIFENVQNEEIKNFNRNHKKKQKTKKKCKLVYSS